MIVIEASFEERTALAVRFGLSLVESLRAEVTLESKPTAIKASGLLMAALLQPCGVSGEDFPVIINEPIDLRFVETHEQPPSGSEEQGEIELEADDCDEIDYSGDMFDLGEAIAQSLGLAIDPYAEGPNADTARKAAGIVPEGEAQGQLAAALAALKKN
jgi:hypothetical protein